MSMILILPWLPIVLAVGVGSRLLDRVRGLTLGSLGALFWVVLIQASVDPSMLMRGWLIVSLLVGSATIIAVGVWSGHTATARRGSRDDQDTSPDSVQAQAGSRLPVADILRRFDDWLEAHRHTEDPWPEFGEFLRTLLYDFCQATHVRPYRILSEGDVLMPLRALEAGDTRDLMSARRGIAGHVATAGVSYIAGDPTHGQLVDELAEESTEHLDWCFAIQQGGRRIGLVKAAQVSAEVRRDRRYLEAAESLVSFFWATLIETCRSRAAQSRDSVVRFADSRIFPDRSRAGPASVLRPIRTGRGSGNRPGGHSLAVRSRRLGNRRRPGGGSGQSVARTSPQRRSTGQVRRLSIRAASAACGFSLGFADRHPIGRQSG